MQDTFALDRGNIYIFCNIRGMENERIKIASLLYLKVVNSHYSHIERERTSIY